MLALRSDNERKVRPTSLQLLSSSSCHLPPSFIVSSCSFLQPNSLFWSSVDHLHNSLFEPAHMYTLTSLHSGFVSVNLHIYSCINLHTRRPEHSLAPSSFVGRNLSISQGPAWNIISLILDEQIRITCSSRADIDAMSHSPIIIVDMFRLTYRVHYRII